MSGKSPYAYGKKRDWVWEGTAFKQFETVPYTGLMDNPTGVVSAQLPLGGVGYLKKFVQQGTTFMVFDYMSGSTAMNQTFHGHHFAVGLENETISPRVSPEEWHPLDLYSKIDEKRVRPYKNIEQHWERYPQK